MNIDALLLLSENQPITTATTNSKVVFIGPSLQLYHTLFLNVTLTTPFTSGSLNRIKLQTSVDEEFTAPIDLFEITLLGGINQSKASFLAQFRMPPATKDYVRLIYTATAPVGGVVFASLVREIPLR